MVTEMGMDGLSLKQSWGIEKGAGWAMFQLLVSKVSVTAAEVLTPSDGGNAEAGGESFTTTVPTGRELRTTMKGLAAPPSVSERALGLVVTPAASLSVLVPLTTLFATALYFASGVFASSMASVIE